MKKSWIRENSSERTVSHWVHWTYRFPTGNCDLWFNNPIICFFTQGRPISFDWPPTANKRPETHQSLKQAKIKDIELYNKPNLKKRPIWFLWNYNGNVSTKCVLPSRRLFIILHVFKHDFIATPGLCACHLDEWDPSNNIPKTRHPTKTFASLTTKDHWATVAVREQKRVW